MAAKGKAVKPRKVGGKASKAAGSKAKGGMPWLAYFMFPVVLALCVLLFGFGGGGGSDGAKSASFGDLRLDTADDGAAEGYAGDPLPHDALAADPWGGMTNACNVELYLQDHQYPAAGQHVMCIERSGDGLRIVGAKQLSNDVSARFAFDAQASDLAALRPQLQSGIGFSRSSNHWPVERKQPWALFTAGGRRLQSLDHALSARTVFLLEGGQWVWPGVRIGHVQSIHGFAGSGGGDGSDSVAMETLSLRPLVFSIKDFISTADAKHIRKISAPHLKTDSTVSHLDHDIGKKDSTWRTSQTHWLSSGADPEGIVAMFNRRVSVVTRVPTHHQEHVQMLHYHPGAGYDMHIDAFDPDLYTKSPDIMGMIDQGHTNRLANIFAYLSDVEEGGETIFPRTQELSGRQPSTLSHKMCEEVKGGLRSKPELGKVLLFYILHPNGNIDQDALHGACSVKKGVKWSANKWMWNRPQMHVGVRG